MPHRKNLFRLMIWGSYRRPIIKIALALLIFLSSLIVGLIATLQFSSVQTKVAGYLTTYLSKKIGMPVSISKVNINWFSQIELTDVTILDQANEVLISAHKIWAVFNPLSLFKNNTISFLKVRIDQGDVRIVRYKPDEDFNMNIFVKAINNLSKSSSKNGRGTKFIIHNAILQNSSFTLSDPFKDSLINQFNYNQFRLKNIDADLGNLEIFHGNFYVGINDLSCTDSATQFKIAKLICNYAITDTLMTFNKFSLDAGKSYVLTDFSFKYKNQGDMSSFNDLVTISAKVGNSRIFSKDLGLFATYFKSLNEFFVIEGKFNGKISNFDVKDFKLQIGNVTRVAGNLLLNGLPDYKNTFIDLNIKNSLLNPEDLINFIPENILETCNKFGNSSFIGRFTGFPKDFVAYASFFTQIGEIESDINFKFSGEKIKAKYSGNIRCIDLDLGVLLGNQNLYQALDLNGFIEGSGIRLNDMDVYLKASIDRIGIYHYDYTGINTDGRLSTNIFAGYLSINDPNLRLSANANINLEKNKEKIRVEAKLDTALLKALNLTNRFSFLSSEISVDLNGLQIDSLSGYINAKNTKFIYGDNGIVINNLSFTSSKTGSERSVSFRSDNLNFNVDGSYDYSVLIREFPVIYKEFKILINNDSSEIAQYFNFKKPIDKTFYNLNFKILIKNLNPFLQLFEPDLYLSDNSTISGFVKGGDKTLLKLESEIDTLKYKDITLIDNKLLFNSDKITRGQELNSNLQFTSSFQNKLNNPGFSGLNFSVNWVNNNIQTRFAISQPSKNNRIDLKTNIDLLANSTVFKIIPVELTILNEQWDISQNNYIIKKGENFNIHDLLIYNQEQSIIIDGTISEDTTEILNIGINNFRIENINPLLPKVFYGKINGYINIERVYNSPRINSRLYIDSLILEKFYIGDINISSIWDNYSSRFQISLDVFKENKNLIGVSGYYSPLLIQNQLDLKASLKDANLNVLEPFYDDLISDLMGKANGEFSISGNINSPILKGSAEVSDGLVTLDYLNTNYTINGKVLFSEQEINLSNITLRDRYNNSGILKGTIQHRDFKNLLFNLKCTFSNLNLLNTSVKNNSLYHGTAYGTGNISITGQDNNINIRINATCNSGTRLFIPLTGGEEVRQENFIQFGKLNNENAISKNTNEKPIRLNGIKLDFNLDINPDAYCEIIFDPTAGDIIRGRGNGKLSLQIDTKGEFNMFGEYEITEGSYNFTLYNIINKAFTIEPGGTITWSGNPYSANLNLNAEYTQYASLIPLFGPQDSAFLQNAEVKRKYQTSVILKLKGPLMSPDINFDIDIKNYPQNLIIDGVSFSTTVSAFKNEIAADEQELKRQVFSLIVLRKFAEKGSFSVPNSVGSSVSELISNQLSYWITQLDKNLEVNLDLGAIDQKATNTFQLTLSYSLAEGRLRITRAGNIYADQTSNMSNIIGDWTVEYLLSPDGKLRAKMYNRFNYNTIIGAFQGNATNSTGFSLMHTQGFDNLNEIFTKKNNKNRNQNRKYIQYDEGIIPSESQDKEKTNTPDK